MPEALPAEDVLASVLDGTHQPVWLVDAGGVIRFANPAALRLGGTELVGRPAQEALRAPPAVSKPLGDGTLLVFGAAEPDAALAAQQASLRRVAALVAGGAASAEVFAAIAREVGQVVGLPLVALWRYEPDRTATVLGAWGGVSHPFAVGSRWPLDGPTICAMVLDSGRPSRIDDFGALPGTIAHAARRTGIRSCAGAPIVVDGRIWGAMSADQIDPEPLPAGIEYRLVEFTELVATAISNSESREALRRLADEQAALRRVATLVARAVPPDEVFDAVAGEVGALLDVDAAHVGRFEADDTVTGAAAWARGGRPLPLPERAVVEPGTVTGKVQETGSAARVDSYEQVSGALAARMRDLGIRSSVGVPITADGRLWGVLVVSSAGARPAPADAESRLAAFSELIATAISNSAARAEVRRLADEQASLRRVATLVAEGAPEAELLGAVTAEAGRLLGADLAGMIRFVADDATTAVATWVPDGDPPEVRGVWPLEGDRLSTSLLTTRRPARQDDWTGASGPIAVFLREQLGIRSSVGSPIVVGGRVWGGLFVHSKTGHPLPPDTDTRLTNFTELTSTALSNAQVREEASRLADEQAALRRVATLVARESPPAEVFAAVAREVGKLLAIASVHVCRYEGEASAVVVGEWGGADAAPVGALLGLAPDSLTSRVREAGRPVRLDDHPGRTGPIVDWGRRLRIGSAVGTPIVVEGRVWGVMVASSRTTEPGAEPLPPDTETRLGQFTELVATAISNVQARADLAASRARLVAAADEERRRVVRDLHDGAQQRLVQTVLTLKLALQALEDGSSALVSEALDHAERATVEVRELAHGLLPAVLTQGGLRAGVEALASRMTVPVDNRVAVERLPAAVEATAYFVVAESLTNVAKHARATRATVTAQVEGGSLRIEVGDDGVGGAQLGGTGFVGLVDRLAVLDGTLRLESHEGGGTLVTADLPLP